MIEIRETNINDVNGIAFVHVNTWKTAYKGILRASYLDNLSLEKSIVNNTRALENEDTISYVATAENGKVVGFIMGGPCRDQQLTKGYAEIYGIYILEEFSLQGIGKKLVLEIFFKFKNIGLTKVTVDFLAGNSAEKFYFRLGARYLKSKTYKIDNTDYLVHTYLWNNINDLI